MVELGIWIPKALVDRDETVTFSGLANVFQGRRAVGGRVTVTNRQFLFVPNRFDRILGGRRISLQRSDLKTVRINAAGRAAARNRGIGGMLNEQVEIESHQGSVALVVSDAKMLVDKLNDAPS